MGLDKGLDKGLKRSRNWGPNTSNEQRVDMGRWCPHNLQWGCGMATQGQCRRLVLGGFSHTIREASTVSLVLPQVYRRSNLVHGCNGSCESWTFLVEVFCWKGAEKSFNLFHNFNFFLILKNR